jgi:hypothetical protein
MEENNLRLTQLCTIDPSHAKTLQLVIDFEFYELKLGSLT